MMPLTPAQQRVFDFISTYIGQNAMAPTYEEIAAGVGLRSISNVHKHLEALKARGHIRREPLRRVCNGPRPTYSQRVRAIQICSGICPCCGSNLAGAKEKT